MRPIEKILAMVFLANCGGASSPVTGPVDSGSSDYGVPGEPVTVTYDDVIDDFEDGDDGIANRGFRAGYWYPIDESFPNGAALFVDRFFEPSVGGADNSGFCARATGAGSISGGDGIAFDLNNVGDPSNPGRPTNRKTYPLSIFKGVSFKAKGNVRMHFAVATEDIIPVPWKGTCIDDAGDRCDRAHQATLTLTPEWQTFTVPFAALVQPAPGTRIPLDLNKAMAMRFFVGPGASFDVSLDDLGLYQ